MRGHPMSPLSPYTTLFRSHGRPAPDQVVAEVRRRFEHIGGSPLMRITHEQAAALEQRLALPVRAAGRLWHPYPSEVLSELAADRKSTRLNSSHLVISYAVF